MRKLALIVVGMFGFGFLMVPIYNVLCEVTGLNGKTGVIEASQASALEVDRSREITVEFIANLNLGANWDFRPEVGRMKVHPGATYTTTYFAKNNSSRVLVGQAVPSVSPPQAARFLKKLDCFCFTEQAFLPGEKRELKVRFIVVSALPDYIDTMTLSYTFFDATRLSDASTQLSPETYSNH